MLIKVHVFGDVNGDPPALDACNIGSTCPQAALFLVWS
jgi:hypothetical protein